MFPELLPVATFLPSPPFLGELSEPPTWECVEASGRSCHRPRTPSHTHQATRTVRTAATLEGPVADKVKFRLLHWQRTPKCTLGSRLAHRGEATPSRWPLGLLWDSVPHSPPCFSASFPLSGDPRTQPRQQSERKAPQLPPESPHCPLPPGTEPVLSWGGITRS